jgi:hypothetical protein
MTILIFKHITIKFKACFTSKYKRFLSQMSIKREIEQTLLTISFIFVYVNFSKILFQKTISDIRKQSKAFACPIRDLQANSWEFRSFQITTLLWNNL